MSSIIEDTDILPEIQTVDVVEETHLVEEIVPVVEVQEEPIPVVVPVIAPAPVQDDVVMYKTDRGYNINAVALAKDAREDLDRVQIIGVPAPVKLHRIGRAEFEAPTLSEVGGGARNQFCQVVAGKDGRPVSVDDIHYINTDPTRTNINHGTASVGIGNYFSIGWSMKADSVILIYEVIGLSEYIAPVTAKDTDKAKPVAKLTCRLVGHEISDWKKSFLNVPSHLSALLEATRLRMRNDSDIPFYMDIFRMIRPVPELNTIAEQVLSSEFQEHNEHGHQFINDVMQEILDIRYSQYGAIPPNAPKRKVDAIRLVETLSLDENFEFIDITLTPVRNDGIQMTTFRLRLTRHNFCDDYGQMLVERGLVLNRTSFEQLRIDLEGRRDKPCIVHLTSLR